jgi:hypothetical protein
MKLYSVHFIDCNDGYPNHKLLEAASAEEVRSYMDHLGHTITEIEERKGE